MENKEIAGKVVYRIWDKTQNRYWDGPGKSFWQRAYWVGYHLSVNIHHHDRYEVHTFVLSKSNSYLPADFTKLFTRGVNKRNQILETEAAIVAAEAHLVNLREELDIQTKRKPLKRQT